MTAKQRREYKLANQVRKLLMQRRNTKGRVGDHIECGQDGKYTKQAKGILAVIPV